MGNVILSPNIKKTSVRIDTSGNIIDKDTKQILEANIPEPTSIDNTFSVNTQPEAPQSPQTNSFSEKVESIIQAKLASKIDEIVEKKVAEILSKL